MATLKTSLEANYDRQTKTSYRSAQKCNLEVKLRVRAKENNFLIDSLEESKQCAAALTATNNILNNKNRKAEIEVSKHHS